MTTYVVMPARIDVPHVSATLDETFLDGQVDLAKLPLAVLVEIDEAYGLLEAAMAAAHLQRRALRAIIDRTQPSLFDGEAA